MLALLRRKAQSPYIQATVVAIIIVFMFWGVGVNQGPGRNDVATVNGEPITYSTFQQTYEQTLDQYRQRFGGAIPAGLKDQLNLDRQVLNQLIHKKLLQQGGRDMGVHISDLEVQKSIENMAVFQINGSFDKMRYEEALKNAGMTPSKFEDGVRSDILANKVAFYIQNFSAISPLEFDKRLHFNLAERQIDYVSLQSGDFTGQVKITEDKLKSYFEENRGNYKTDPRLKLQYLFFSGKDNGSGVDITDKMIEDYYNRHQEDYRIPEKRRARHILLKTDSQDGGSEALEKEMKKILSRAEGGEDFGELAGQYSEDQTTASRGGDLGYFTRGEMVKPFAEKVFSMEEGEISDIVRTRFGLHIIKLEDITPARTEPLQEVEKEIEKKLRRDEAERIAFARANEAYENIIRAGSLKAYAGKENISPETTGFFSINEAPEPLSANPAALNKIFQLKEGELSSIIEGADGYFIIYVKARREPYVPELNKVQDRVQADLQKDLAADLAKKKAEEILTQVREQGDGLQAAAGRMSGLTPVRSGFFSRNNRNADLPRQVIAAAFSLTEKNPYPDKVVSARGSFYVIHLREIRKPDPEQVENEKEEFREKLVQEKQNQVINSWLDHLMQESEIRINEKRLKM